MVSDSSSHASSDSSSPTLIPTCSALDCSKPASQQCPTCVQFKLPPTRFCSQECFKAAWKSHNAVHKAERDRLNFIPPTFDYTGPLRPAYVSPRLTVPSHIPRPEYAETGIPKTENEMRGNLTIHIHTQDEIKRMRESCRLGREILDIAHRAIRPGITTDEIDRIVHAATIARNAYPSPLNYNNFPKSCCTSVNEVICHGIPDARPLQDGDIVNVDISCYYQGMHADLNETFVVGKVDDESKKLIKCTYDAMMLAIQAVKPGTFVRDFGEIITKFCNKAGFSVVRSYCGHGIGELFHSNAPNIPHYARNKGVGVLRPGMIFTIEPMINVGTWRDVLWTFDGWTSTTTDGKRSAQFEHTVLVTDRGCEILTARTPNSPPFFWEHDGKIDTTCGWNGNNQLTYQSQKTTTTTQNENKDTKIDEDGDDDGDEDETTKETGATGAAKKKKKKKKRVGAVSSTTPTTTTV